MKKIVTMGFALAGLFGAVAPAHASVLGDLLHEFENHCTVGRSSASCHISKTKIGDLPDTTVPAGETTSHGPVWGDQCGPFAVDIPMPGGKVFCVADYTSYMSKNADPSYVIDGGTGKVCETKTATLVYAGFKLTHGSSTSVGACH